MQYEYISEVNGVFNFSIPGENKTIKLFRGDSVIVKQPLDGNYLRLFKFIKEVEDVKVEDVKVEDVKVEDVKVEDVKVEDVKVEDVKVDKKSKQETKISDKITNVVELSNEKSEVSKTPTTRRRTKKNQEK